MPHDTLTNYFQSWIEDAVWTVQHNVFIAVLTKFIVSAGVLIWFPRRVIFVQRLNVRKTPERDFQQAQVQIPALTKF